MSGEKGQSGQKPNSKQDKAAARADRLKAQLRQNLHRRKSQSRVRGTGKNSGQAANEG